MTSEQQATEKPHLRRALEITIHLGLVALLATACLLVLSPFIAVLGWGLTIAIAGYPAYGKLRKWLGGRGGLASVVVTVVLLTILIIPIVMMGRTLIESSRSLAARLQNGTLTIPPPPPNIASWPVIGKPLSTLWSSAATNLTSALWPLTPTLKEAVSRLLSVAASVGIGVLQLFVSIVIAGFFLANADPGARFADKIAQHLFGSKAEEVESLAVATVRSVTTGILGVALIQTVLAGLGFMVVGLPGPGLWGLVFLIAAVVQAGGLVLIPAVIYVFATASTAKAVAFLIWCIFVGLIDNVLKPLLLGRGLPVPMVVVFLGAMGGFVAMGILGLFVGPIVLSVGYKLVLAWLDEGLGPAPRSTPG